MANNYGDVISNKSTEELKSIYLDKFLDYQENFVKECYEELIRRRCKTEIDDVVNQRKSQVVDNVAEITQKLQNEGRTKKDIERFLIRYEISSDDTQRALDNISWEEKYSKWSKIENGIIVGPIIVGIVLIMDYCGYVIVIKGYNIPISTLLLFFGAVWFIAGLVAKMYLSSMDD